MQQTKQGLKARQRAPDVAGGAVGDPARLIHAWRSNLLACSVTNFLETRNLIGLGAFASLYYVEFHLVALFQAFVAFTLDGAVVNEDVCPAVPAEEAVTLCVVKPFDCALVLCQWSHSLVSKIAGREVKVFQRLRPFKRL